MHLAGTKNLANKRNSIKIIEVFTIDEYLLAKKKTILLFVRPFLVHRALTLSMRLSRDITVINEGAKQRLVELNENMDDWGTLR